MYLLKSGGGKGFLNFAVGGIISFNLNYFGLLSCMTLPYIDKLFTGTLDQIKISIIIEGIYERY